MKYLKKPTVWAVLLFIALTILFATQEVQAHAPTSSGNTITFGMSVGVAGSDGVRTQRLAYRYQDTWEFAYARVGGKGWSDTNYISVSRLMHWRGNDRGPFLSLGAAYTDSLLTREAKGKALVSEQFTFELGIGYRWVLSAVTDIEVRYLHNSTAGRSEENKGIDRVGLIYNWRF